MERDQLEKAAKMLNPNAEIVEVSPGHYDTVVPEDKKVCDFCLSPEGPFTVFITKEFILKAYGVTTTYDPLWSACPACSTLIEADDKGGLFQRMLESAKRKHGIHEAFIRDDLFAVIEKFWENRVHDEGAPS